MATNIQPNCQAIPWIDVTNPTHEEMRQLSENYGLNRHIIRDGMQPACPGTFLYLTSVISRLT